MCRGFRDSAVESVTRALACRVRGPSAASVRRTRGRCVEDDATTATRAYQGEK
jgi:hypothetical protein